MKRREFLTTTLAASTLAGLGTASLTASAATQAGPGKREPHALERHRMRRLAGRAGDAGYGHRENRARQPRASRTGLPLAFFSRRRSGHAGLLLRAAARLCHSR